MEKEIVQILFDTENRTPIFVLNDGTKMYGYYSYGPQGLELEWLTLEEIKRIERRKNANQ